jgi:hypothetical protein
LIVDFECDGVVDTNQEHSGGFLLVDGRGLPAVVSWGGIVHHFIMGFIMGDYEGRLIHVS